MRLLAPLLLLLIGAAAPEQRSFLVSSFERLRVDGPFRVDVGESTASSAVAEGSAAALRQVTIRVEGSTLIVSAGLADAAVLARDRIELPRVTITGPALRGVLVAGGGTVSVARLAGQRVDAGVNGSGRLTIARVEAEDISVSLTGTGALTLSGKAGQARFTNYGAGSIDASGLVVDDLIASANTAGDSSFNVRYTARINSNGLGAVRVSGRPKCFVRGTGPIACGENAAPTD